MSLTLAISSGRQLIRGDFQTEVVGGHLTLPSELFEVLKKLNSSSLEEFLSLLQAFPSALATELGWTVEDVRDATKKLYNQLKGIVPDDYLEGNQTSRQFGAFNPIQSKNHKG